MGKRKPASVVPDRETVIALQKQVRVILSALPKGRFASKPVLRAKLEAMGFTFTDAELDAAVEWNHERNYVDFISNDYGTDEWFLTAKGKAKA